MQEIRLSTMHEVGDTQNLATILVDPEGKGLVDHWAKTSHAFLTGAVLHVLYKKRAGGKVGSLQMWPMRYPIPITQSRICM